MLEGLSQVLPNAEEADDAKALDSAEGGMPREPDRFLLPAPAPPAAAVALWVLLAAAAAVASAAALMSLAEEDEVSVGTTGGEGRETREG